MQTALLFASLMAIMLLFVVMVLASVAMMLMMMAMVIAILMIGKPFCQVHKTYRGEFPATPCAQGNVLENG